MHNCFISLIFGSLRLPLCVFVSIICVHNEWIGLYEIVDPWHCTMSKKLIMHKHAFRNIFTAGIPCFTSTATIATNWIMRLSFEQWMEQDVISWKTVFVKKLSCMWVTCGAEWWFVMRKGKGELCGWMWRQFSLSAHGDHKLFPAFSSFILYISCLPFLKKKKVKLNISKVCFSQFPHCCLDVSHVLINNKWGRPLKLFTETQEDDWWYFYQFYSWGIGNSD